MFLCRPLLRRVSLFKSPISLHLSPSKIHAQPHGLPFTTSASTPSSHSPARPTRFRDNTRRRNRSSDPKTFSEYVSSNRIERSRASLPLVVFDTLRRFANGDILDKISDSHLREFTQHVVFERGKTHDDEGLAILLLSAIMTRLEKLDRVPVGAESVTHVLPDIVHAAFELLYHLLLLDKEASVLELFRVLAEKLYIPPEAMQQAPTASGDFNYVVSVTLARACLYWYKRDLAHRLLLRRLMSRKDLMSFIQDRNNTLSAPGTSSPIVSPTVSQQSLDPQFLDLITDTLYATLRNPNRIELSLCVDIICRVHLSAPVQSGIVRLLYTAAAESDSGGVARRLYAFTREPGIEAEHHYPSPQGPALLFLMRFLTDQKGNTHLARALANEVVDNDAFLPVYDRGRFVAVVAGQGFARAARALWERYAVGKDKRLVTGQSSLMIRMVKLFTNVARATEAAAQDRSSTEERNEDVVNLEERARDISKFVQRVIAEFVESLEPLSEAKHPHLSTLARAYFVAGNFVGGFRTFQILLRRLEVPDLYDINIALSALSEHSPRRAAKMIEMMIQRGVQPDSVTFSTVIHHALAHGDVQLVGDLLSRAREAGNIQLSSRGIFSLTRASVSFENEEGKDDSLGGTNSTHLKDALALLKATPEKGRFSSPDMGKYMVYASLRQHETELAFEFWRLLLMQSAEWEDPEHVYIRSLLRRRILQSSPSENEGRTTMLYELTMRPPFDARR